MILQYILLAVLLVCSLTIVVAVTLTKSNEEGLSGTIVGGNDTYYGKDKSARTGRKLFLVTMITSIVFAVAVLLIYFLQPDYSSTSPSWQSVMNYISSEFTGIFG